jgi:N-acyl homoserine lactone hydrolase
MSRSAIPSACVLWSLLLVSVFVTGCDSTQQVPRIDPVLRNWRQPYQGIDGLRVHVFTTGTMVFPSGLVFRGGSWTRRRELDVLAFVVEHPSAGLVVFDTGLSPRVGEDPASYLGLLLTSIGEFSMARDQQLSRQMEQAGLDASRVSHVVLSHMHFDHTGDVEAFPNATVVVARDEREASREPSWLGDFYFEDDYGRVSNWLEVDYADGEPFATFSSHHDLLGDGSIVLVDLSGHTTGSQGMLVRASPAPVLLTGGAASIEESWRYAARPAVAAEPALWWDQVWRIKKFVQLVPEAVIVPAHDLAAAAKNSESSLLIHELEPHTDGSAR